MNFDSSTGTLTCSGSGVLEKPLEYKDKAKIVKVEGSYTSTASECFWGFSLLEKLTVTDSIEFIGNNLFAGTKVKEFHIPKQLQTLDPNQPFDHNYNLEKFTIDPDHKHYSVIDDSLYTKDGKMLCFYPGGKNQTVFRIPEGVERIFIAAIAHSTILEEVVIPSSVTTVDESFGYCATTLKKVVVLNCVLSNAKDNIKWAIGQYSFNTCGTKYEEIEWRYQPFSIMVTLNGSFMSVFPSKQCPFNPQIDYNEQSFSGNTKLESISFDYGITAIKAGCFVGCSKLSHLSFPPTLKSIDANAFSGTHLRSYSCIFYPKSILHILIPHFTGYSLGLGKLTNFLCRSFLSPFVFFTLLINK